MSSDPKQGQEPEPDDDVEREYDDDGQDERESDKTSTPATMKGSTALESLAALQSMLSSVDRSMLSVRSGRPLMQFKSRENGTWMFGRNRTVVEDGSWWAFDPRSFVWGYICFGADKKPISGGNILVSIGKPKPDVTKLPDLGFPWTEQRGVAMKCVSGTDTGVEVDFRINTDGGVKAIDALIDTAIDRVRSGEHKGKVAPVATLNKDSYPHTEHGRIFFPVITIVDWMPLDGPAPKPAPAEPTPPADSAPGSATPADQPRRRRVA